MSQPEEQDVTVDINDLVRLLHRVIGDFCEDTGVTGSARYAIEATKVLEWYEIHDYRYAQDRVEEPQLWEMFGRLTAKVEVFREIWYRALTADRGGLKHEVDTVHVLAVVKWRDGRVLPISSYLPVPNFDDPEMELDDGRTLAVIAASLGTCTKRILQNGLDVLRSNSHDCGSEDLFRRFVLHCKRFAADPTIAPNEKEQAATLVGAALTLFQPEIAMPQDAVERIHACRRQREELRNSQTHSPPQKPPTDAPIVGGWDSGT